MSIDECVEYFWVLLFPVPHEDSEDVVPVGEGCELVLEARRGERVRYCKCAGKEGGGRTFLSLKWTSKELGIIPATFRNTIAWICFSGISRCRGVRERVRHKGGRAHLCSYAEDVTPETDPFVGEVHPSMDHNLNNQRTPMCCEQPHKQDDQGGLKAGTYYTTTPHHLSDETSSATP